MASSQPSPPAADPAVAGTAALRHDALPTDTAVRFALLLITVTTASLYLFQALWLAVRGAAFVEGAAACEPNPEVSLAVDVDRAWAAFEARRACLSSLSWEQVGAASVGALLVLVVAWVAYRWRPSWRERRSHLSAVDPVDGAGLLAEVDALSGGGGVRTPSVRIDAANPGVQAFAYGAGRRQRLGLTGGLVVQQVLDPPAFRAVVRHELGHVANRDVAWTYYTVSVWWSFIAVALVPVVVVFAISSPNYVLRLGWRVLALAALVAVVGAGLLRIREAYADAQAASWGSRDALVRILGTAPDGTGRRPQWLRVHPTPKERLELLTHPAGLFRADLVTALTTGLAGGTAFAALFAVAGLALRADAAAALAALPVSVLIAAVLCVQAWRVGLREAVAGSRIPLGLPLGLGLGLGLALAPMLTLEAAVGEFAVGLTGWTGYAIWALLTVVLTCLVVRWVADSARLVVATTGGQRPRRAALVAHIGVTWLLVALLLVGGAQSLTLLRELGPRVLLDLPLGAAVGSQVLGWAPVVALAACCAVALITRIALVRRGTASAFVPALRPVLAIGLVAGCTAGLAMAATRLLGGTRAESVRVSDPFELVLQSGAHTTIVTGAVVATAVGAIVCRGRWWPLGLVSGALAGATAALIGVATSMAAGCGLLPSLFPSCGLPGGYALDVLLWQPLVAAAPVALTVAAIVGTLRAARIALRTRASSPPTGARGSREGAAILIGALVAFGVVALVAGAQSARILTVDAPSVSGQGFSVDIPPGWQGREGAARGSAQLVSAGDEVVVGIVPVASGFPTVDGLAVPVGGLDAWPVGARDEAGLRLLAYQVRTPRGWYVVEVRGSPQILRARGDEVVRLLSGVRWGSSGDGSATGRDGSDAG